jgi:acyl transferase domain-containing protein
VSLADIAFTLATGRDRMEHRFTVLADSRNALIAALESGKNVDVDEAALDMAASLAGARRTHLPPYDFDHRRHWVGDES